MTCEKCGAVIEDGHIMCPKCGALVTIGTKNNYGINWNESIQYEDNKVLEPVEEKMVQKEAQEGEEPVEKKPEQEEVAAPVEKDDDVLVTFEPVEEEILPDWDVIDSYNDRSEENIYNSNIVRASDSDSAKHEENTNNYPFRRSSNIDSEMGSIKWGLAMLGGLIFMILVLSSPTKDKDYSKTHDPRVGNWNAYTSDGYDNVYTGFNSYSSYTEEKHNYSVFNGKLYDENCNVVCAKVETDEDWQGFLFDSSYSKVCYIDYANSSDGISGSLYEINNGNSSNMIATDVCEVYGDSVDSGREMYYRNVDGDIYSWTKVDDEPKLCCENVAAFACNPMYGLKSYLCDEDGEYTLYLEQYEAKQELIKGQKLEPLLIVEEAAGDCIYLRDMDTGKIYAYFISEGQLYDYGIAAKSKSDIMLGDFSDYIVVNQEGNIYCCTPTESEPILAVASGMDKIKVRLYLSKFYCVYLKDGRLYETTISEEHNECKVENLDVNLDYVIDDFGVTSSGFIYFLSDGVLNKVGFGHDNFYEILKITGVKELYTDDGFNGCNSMCILMDDGKYNIFVNDDFKLMSGSPF